MFLDFNRVHHRAVRRLTSRTAGPLPFVVALLLAHGCAEAPDPSGSLLTDDQLGDSDDEVAAGDDDDDSSDSPAPSDASAPRDAGAQSGSSTGSASPRTPVTPRADAGRVTTPRSPFTPVTPTTPSSPTTGSTRDAGTRVVDSGTSSSGGATTPPPSTGGGSGGDTPPTTGGSSSAAKCASTPAYPTADACAQCICEKCATQVADCYGSADASKNEQCGKIQACAEENQCTGADCYCGESTICLDPGGSCVEVIQSVVGTTSSLDVLEARDDPASPVSRANAIGECSSTSCARECGL